MSHSHLTGVSPKRPNPVEGNSRNLAGPEGPKEVPPLILKVPRGPPTRILPPSGHRDEGTEMPASCSRDPAPPAGRPARASSGSRKQKRALLAPRSVVSEAPRDWGEDGGGGVSGLFPGGCGGRAGPRRVTASPSGRPPAPEGGAPRAGWPGLAMLGPASRGRGGPGPRSPLEVGPVGWVSAVHRRSRKLPCGNRTPDFTFPFFGHLLITRRSAASRKSTPPPYVASPLLRCNDHFFFSCFLQ